MTHVGDVSDEFNAVLGGRRLRTVFQPIVNLESGDTVGFESLVRGPEGSSLASAGSLLAAAYRSGRVGEFDWSARASACRTALAAGLGRDQLVFMNVEPLALDSECPPDLWPDIEAGFAALRIVLEVTERSLDHDPGVLLDGLDRLRVRVEGLAVDDVGAEPATLAMMPLIAPAVIKLDINVTQSGITSELIKTLDIVYEEAERTNATVLAEGIENRTELSHARSLGAILGQGRHLGDAAPLGDHAGRPARRFAISAQTPPSVKSPWDVSSGRLIGRADRDLLVALSRRIESAIELEPVPALLISLFPEPHLFGREERRTYGRLADLGATAAVIGPGIPAEPGDGIRGIGRRLEAPIEGEWAVVALSPASSSALLARVAQDDNAEFEFGVTHDTQRVITAARCLFRRLGAPTPQWTPRATTD